MYEPKQPLSVAGSMSFNVAGQDGRGNYPQHSMLFDMAKRRVWPASGLFEGH